MSPELLLQLAQIVLPTVGAYVSCQIGIARANERADTAKIAAERAHARIDEHLAGHP